MSDKKIKAKCIECQANIDFSADVKSGEVITCPDCTTDLEVKQVKPLKLGIAPAVQEDWGQ